MNMYLTASKDAALGGVVELDEVYVTAGLEVSEVSEGSLGVEV